MKWTLSLPLLFAGISSFVVGCSPASVAPSTDAAKPVSLSASDSKPTEGSSVVMRSVAVVDLDEVARQTGYTQNLFARLKEKEDELNERMQLFKSGYQDELDKKKKSFGDKPTPEQEQELKQTTATYNANILQAKQIAQNELAQFKASVQMEASQKLRPYVQKVADAKKMDIVLTISQVYSANAAVDITTEVIREVQKNGGTPDSGSTLQAETASTKKLDAGGGAFKPAK